MDRVYPILAEYILYTVQKSRSGDKIVNGVVFYRTIRWVGAAIDRRNFVSSHIN